MTFKISNLTPKLLQVSTENWILLYKPVSYAMNMKCEVIALRTSESIFRTTKSLNCKAVRTRVFTPDRYTL